MPFLTFLSSSGLSHSLTELVYQLITIAIDSCHNLWAGMGQIFLGLKEKCQVKHPASGKVIQREA